jgi:hypothetical protein
MSDAPMDDPLGGRLLHGTSLHWPGVGRRGSVILPLSAELFRALPAQLSLRSLQLPRKDEFHITLFNADEWQRVLATHGEAAVAAAAGALDWCVRSDGFYWLVRRPDDDAWRTVIVTVHAPALARLRATLSTSDCLLPSPTTHVTLYCSDNRGGIGVSGSRQWEERVVGALRIDWSASGCAVASCSNASG